MVYQYDSLAPKFSLEAQGRLLYVWSLYITETIIKRLILKGATSQFAHLEKFRLHFFKFVFCNPCQSSPSLTILVPLWSFISLVFFVFFLFFYLSKLIFSGILYLKVILYVAKITQNTMTELLLAFFVLF